MPREHKDKYGLNTRERAFCHLVIAPGCSHSEAARLAGYRPSSAGQWASKLLKLPKIAAYIEVLKQGLAKKTDINTESILRQLKIIAESDLRNYIKTTGMMRLENSTKPGVVSFSDTDPDMIFRTLEEVGDAAMAVKKFSKKVSREGDVTYTFELHDKLRALDLLGNYLRMWRAQNASSQPQVPAPADGAPKYGPVLILPDNGHGRPPGWQGTQTVGVTTITQSVGDAGV